MSSLTPLQIAFIEKYFACNMNGTEAVVQAGYQVANRATASAIASENLRKPKIREIVNQRLEEMAMPANEVLMRLSEMARLDLGPYLKTFEVEGQKFTGIDVDALIADGRGHLITEIYYDASGNQRVKFVDSQNALVQLGRAHGLFTDRTDITSGGDKIQAPQIYLPAVADEGESENG